MPRLIPESGQPRPGAGFDTRAHFGRPRVAGITVLLACGFGVLLLALSTLLHDAANPFPNAYLLPWIFLVLAVVCLPTTYLAMRGRFELFHPLVYAAWSYFVPAFVVGPLYLTTRLNDRWFVGLISDPERYLALTLFYIALGFAGLTLGFSVPLGRRIGEALSRKLPTREWEAGDVFKPAMVMIALGEVFRLGAFASGSAGFQSTDDVATYGATLNMLSAFSSMGSFLMWYGLFRISRMTTRHYWAMLLLGALLVYTTILSGGKGALFNSTVLIIAAFVYSGRRIARRHALLIGLAITMTMLVGFVFGTVFRELKGNEAQVSLDEYLSVGVEAIDRITNQGMTENWQLGIDAIVQRIETLSQVAVFVANYETLRPAEASYGVADIWTMTWTAFIPRAVWPGKPNISGARGLGLLYFNYGGSSPAVTPMIDLLRNFGPLGIPLGMALLGMVVRIMYAALIEGQALSTWRVAGYILLITHVSYESMYGNILPILLRMCVVLVTGLVILSIMTKRRAATGGTRIANVG